MSNGNRLIQEHLLSTMDITYNVIYTCKLFYHGSDMDQMSVFHHLVFLGFWPSQYQKFIPIVF